MSFNKAIILKTASKYVQQGKYQAAIVEYRKVVQADPSDITTLNILGDVCVKAGETSEASRSFARIAEHYRKDNSRVKAIAMLKKASKLDPTNVEIALRLAALYSQQDLMVEAQQQYLIAAEHYLRVLRFFRFHARYARIDPEPAELAALAAAVPHLSRLSAERVWSELKRILEAPDPRAALALMARLDVLAAVLPEGTDLARLDRVIATGAPIDAVLRLAALLDGDAEALAARLRLSVEERDRLMALRAGPVPDPSADDAALRRMLADAPADILIGRTWLVGAGPERDALRARLAAMPRPVFPMEGRDALALGFSPGPEVGRALRTVRAWWLAGGCIADAAACRAELARYRPG